MPKLALAFVLVTVAIGALGAGAALGATKTVGVGDNFFAPKRLSIAKGTTVTWRWRGRNPHNVTGRGVRSPTQTRGTYSRRFRRAGRYRLVCTLHAGMEMTVRVR